MWSAFDRAIVAVKDLAAAREGYARLLGRRPSFEGHEPDRGTRSVWFRLANASVELRAPAAPGSCPSLEARLAERGEGVLGIGLAADDAEAAAAWLTARPALSQHDLALRGWESTAVSGERWVRREIDIDLCRSRGFPITIACDVDPDDGAPLAVADVPEEAAIGGIDHVVVRTADADRSIEVYRDMLGLRLALDRAFPERGVRLVFFRLAGVTVELGARMRGVPSEATDLPDTSGGIAFRVPSPAATRARVLDAGLDVSEVRRGNKPGTAVCTVRSGTCGVPTLLIGPE